MNIRTAAIVIGFAAAALPAFAVDAPLVRPKAGKVEIMRLADVKPGSGASMDCRTIGEYLGVENVGTGLTQGSTHASKRHCNHARNPSSNGTVSEMTTSRDR